MRLFHAKRRESAGYAKISRALNQENFLETNSMFVLRHILPKFSDSLSFESELRDMERLKEGIGRMRMNADFEEGYEALNKSTAIKIPAQVYLQSVR